MPAPIIDGLITFLSAQVDANIWDGEVPRYSPAGNPINPESTITGPSDWPVIKLWMKEDGFERNWNFIDPYDDLGEILIQVWTTSHNALEDPTSGLLNIIEALLAQSGNWALIDLGNGGGGTSGNPYYVVSVILKRWYSGMEEGKRTAKSEYIYRGDMHYQVRIHGAIPTR